MRLKLTRSVRSATANSGSFGRSTGLMPEAFNGAFDEDKPESQKRPQPRSAEPEVLTIASIKATLAVS